MRRLRLNDFWLLPLALLVSSCVPDARGAVPDTTTIGSPQSQSLVDAPTMAEEPPPTRTVGEVLDKGVLITISLSSQRMDVFRDGVFWRSSPVSTGKRRKETPPGVFAILQKKKFHRSNLYSNAPMPFMQRLTWSGIAIHAGHLPGYPASHGCIRIPKAFASELYAITGPTVTAVLVVEEPLASEADALALARRTDALVPINPDLLRRERLAALATGKPPGRLPAARTIAAPQPVDGPTLSTPQGPVGKLQTIQLAAALSPGLAAAQWEELSARRPELRAMQMAVIPAVVGGKQYYRLRVSAPDAHAMCKGLKAAGIACFPVS